MAKYNKTKTEKTENLAGGKAYSMTKEYEILSFMATTFVKDNFYRSEDETTQKIEKLFNEYPNKEFIAKCAVHVRTKFGMRSISHIVAALVAKNVKKQEWTKHFFSQVFIRPDDITETLSYYLSKYKKPVPNSLKKGIALALKKFDNYQLAKYKQEDKNVKMVDVLNLVHPVPVISNSQGMDLLINNKLKNTQTWESMLSAAGSDEDKKAQVWLKLITEKKLGYFALLRNLVNINNQAKGIVPKALEQLTDKEAIKHSLVLPFRYYTAYKTFENRVDGGQTILQAINQAAEISMDNVPDFSGQTLVVIDQSGSMAGDNIQRASLFGAILCKKLACDVIGFSDEAHYIGYNPKDSVMTITEKFMKANYGGTNFHAPFKLANKKYDRIIILSDMQGWIDYDTPLKIFTAYCEKYKANPLIYSWDLTGYGTIQFPQDKIFLLAGWSEKIFDIMLFLEEDRNKLLTTINQISFT